MGIFEKWWFMESARFEDVGTGSARSAGQGTAVALSSDGNTLASGGDLDNNNVVAVWVFNVLQAHGQPMP